QLCIAKNHKTVEIIHNLSQRWIDQAPRGLLLTPEITPERRLGVILRLLAQRQTLRGKKVAVLAQTDTKDGVEGTIDPPLKKMRVQQGSTGVLTITSADTSAAQSQLDAFIERWKGEGIDAFIIAGQVVVSKTYVTALKRAFPRAILVSDQTPTALS